MEDIGLSTLDPIKLAQGANIDIMWSFLNRASLCEHDNVVDLIKEYIKLAAIKNKTNNFGLEHFQKMTLDQLKTLGRNIPDFKNDMVYTGELFIKEFEIDYEFEKSHVFGSPSEKMERRNKLLKMHNWAKNLNHKFNSLTDQILYEILQIGIEINNFDFDLFVEYLRNPIKIYPKSNGNNLKLLEQKIQKFETYWNNIHNFDILKWMNHDKLIEAYLEVYFKLENKISPFDEFFDEKYLNELFFKVRLYNGDQIPNISEILSPETLKNIETEKILSICKFNREYFTNEEEVKLYVEIKNISKLIIKIFEFSPEDYYLKKNSEISGEVTIDGLIANEEIYLDFKESPQRKIIKEFAFDKISKSKQGIFLIEFIGVELSSRALIRKGKLILLEKITLSGQIFTIIDESLEICKKSKRMGLWVKNRFHEANEDGVVMIPFSENAESVQVIIVHNDFACLKNINLISENYTFKCSYIYKDEGFLIGKKMKMLIQPKLYLNQQSSSLDIIKEPSISIVTTTGGENQIPSTLELKNVKFDCKQEIEIEIQIPAKLKSITVEVKGNIKKMTGKNITVSDNHTVMINNYENCENNIFCGLFLKYSEAGYEIYALGKNGEPKHNIVINVELTNKFLKSKIKAEMQTDNEGKIFLGELKNITKIRAAIQGYIKSLPKEWSIENCNKINYPSVLNIIEGDSVKLPYFGKELNKSKIAFVRVLNDNKNNRESVLSNEIAQLKISKNMLEIDNLKKGIYKLTLKEEGIKLKIIVHNGKYWKKTDLIVAKNYLLYVEKPLPTIVIQDFKIKTNENGKNDISFSIFSDDMRNTRIHVFAYQFLNEEVDIYCNSIKNNIESEELKIISTTNLRNQYFSNKRLNDELIYVINRKQEQRFLGKTLEKPQILLKRTVLKETNLAKEQLTKEQNYQDFSYNPNDETEKNEADRRRNRKHHVNSQPIKSGIDSFLNFLQNINLIVSNIKPDNQGNILIEGLDLTSYSTLEIIAINNDTIVHEMFPLPKKPILTRDLRMMNNEEKSEKYYSTFRNTTSLKKGSSFNIKDINSTEIQIIDSLEKIFNIQKELQKLNNIPTNENGKDYEDWKFVTKWNSLEIEEKIMKYDEFASHELNIFLFFKDRAFFETFVQPFLKNKIEKSFVDYFLLQNREIILKFNSLGEIHKLNAMEKVLLIVFLISDKKYSDASSIAQYLTNENKFISFDDKNFMKLFDTILGSKSIDSVENEKIGEKEIDSRTLKMKYMRLMRIGDEKDEDKIEEVKKKVDEIKNLMSQNISQVLTRGEDIENLIDKTCCSLQSQASFFTKSAKMSFGVQKSKMIGGFFGSDEDNDQNIFDKNENEEKYMELRSKFVQEFKNLEKTKEYGERQYFNRNLDDTSNLIENNSFWVDLAQHLLENGIETPFLSWKFIYATKNHSTLLAVLAFIDLPFEEASHSYNNISGKQLEISMSSNAIIFHKEIKECQSSLKKDLIISQRFFDPNDRYTYKTIL